MPKHLSSSCSSASIHRLRKSTASCSNRLAARQSRIPFSVASSSQQVLYGSTATREFGIWLATAYRLPPSKFIERLGKLERSTPFSQGPPQSRSLRLPSTLNVH